MLSTLREIPRAESKPLPIIGDSNTNFAADFHVKIRGKTESGKSGATRDKVRVFGKASAKKGADKTTNHMNTINTVKILLPNIKYNALIMIPTVSARNDALLWLIRNNISADTSTKISQIIPSFFHISARNGQISIAATVAPVL